MFSIRAAKNQNASHQRLDEVRTSPYHYRGANSLLSAYTKFHAEPARVLADKIELDAELDVIKLIAYSVSTVRKGIVWFWEMVAA